MSIKITRDGRTIRSGVDYTEFRAMLHELQDAKCDRCWRGTDLAYEPTSDWSFHVHHRNGRGMGGGKRDDSVRTCIGLCGECHRQEHNQQEKVPSKLHWSKIR